MSCARVNRGTEISPPVTPHLNLKGKQDTEETACGIGSGVSARPCTTQHTSCRMLHAKSQILFQAADASSSGPRTSVAKTCFCITRQSRSERKLENSPGDPQRDNL